MATVHVINCTTAGPSEAPIRLAIVDVTIDHADDDFPITGMDLWPVEFLSQLGMTNIIAVFFAQRRTALNAPTSSLLVYDPIEQKLMNATALSNTDLSGVAAVDGDIVRVGLLGY